MFSLQYGKDPELFVFIHLFIVIAEQLSVLLLLEKKKTKKKTQTVVYCVSLFLHQLSSTLSILMAMNNCFISLFPVLKVAL